MKVQNCFKINHNYYSWLAIFFRTHCHTFFPDISSFSLCNSLLSMLCESINLIKVTGVSINVEICSVSVLKSVDANDAIFSCCLCCWLFLEIILPLLVLSAIVSRKKRNNEIPSPRLWWTRKRIYNMYKNWRGSFFIHYSFYFRSIMFHMIDGIAGGLGFFEGLRLTVYWQKSSSKTIGFVIRRISHVPRLSYGSGLLQCTPITYFKESISIVEVEVVIEVSKKLRLDVVNVFKYVGLINLNR